MYRLNNKNLALGVPFTDSEGTNYPANWIINASKSELDGVPTGGITWVADPPIVDQRFYWDSIDKPKDVATLKAQWIQIQKDEANKLLAKTDWMVIRQTEGGTNVPNDTKTYRAAVRTKSKEREDQITACSDTDALAALITASATIAGTASNGATEKKKEKFDTSKEKKDELGNSFDPKQYESFDPKQYESYDPKQWNDITNPDALKAWPTE